MGMGEMKARVRADIIESRSEAALPTTMEDVEVGGGRAKMKRERLVGGGIGGEIEREKDEGIKRTKRARSMQRGKWTIRVTMARLFLRASSGIRSAWSVAQFSGSLGKHFGFPELIARSYRLFLPLLTS